MKYRLTFHCDSEVQLPVHYRKIVQAATLNWLGDTDGYASFLHNGGYENDKRVFKLYTFSDLLGRHHYNKKIHRLIFNDTIQIYLSFYTEESHAYILNNISSDKPFQLGKSGLHLTDCELVKEHYQNCIVDTVSPVTIHSTFELADGRKKTYYYEPRERDFSEMIRQNLVRKYTALYEEEPKDDSFFIKTVGNIRPVDIIYNSFQIKGWNGRFRMEGSEEMIRMALLAGIGARNGIGLGCILQKHCI